MKVTPDTLTDEQILEFGRSLLENTADDASARHTCAIALGLAGPAHGVVSVAIAKQMICNAINVSNGVDP